MKGLYSAAIPVLRECVSKSPQQAVYHFHLGMALLASGEKSLGEEQVLAALKLGLTGDDAQQARMAIAQPD